VNSKPRSLVDCWSDALPVGPVLLLWLACLVRCANSNQLTLIRISFARTLSFLFVFILNLCLLSQ